MMSSGWDRCWSDTAEPLAQGGCHSSLSPPGPRSLRSPQAWPLSAVKAAAANPRPTSIPPILDSRGEVQAEVSGKVKRFLSVSMMLNLLFQSLIEGAGYSLTVLVQQCERETGKGGFRQRSTVKVITLLLVERLEVWHHGCATKYMSKHAQTIETDKREGELQKKKDDCFAQILQLRPPTTFAV